MKIIFSDIDGTLVNDNKHVTPKTKKSIQAWLNAGNLFVPVSARMPVAIKTITDEISTKLPLVSYNGGFIVDANGEVIHSATFSKDLAEKIIAYVEDHNLDLAWNFYSGNDWFSPKLEANLAEEELVHVVSTKATREDIKNLPDPHKLLLIGQAEVLDELLPILQDKFSELYMVKSAPHLLEITRKGIEKGSAVKVINQYFNLNPADTWAFGDNFNDLEMLQAVAHPYLMDNAPDELKKSFSNITSDNNHDGVGEIVEKLGILS